VYDKKLSARTGRKEILWGSAPHPGVYRICFPYRIESERYRRRGFKRRPREARNMRKERSTRSRCKFSLAAGRFNRPIRISKTLRPARVGLHRCAILNASKSDIIVEAIKKRG
jgi:hypothetical protein